MGYILITGVCGMIGNQVANSLLDSGYKIIGLDGSSSKINHDHYVHVKVDLTDCLAVERIFENNDVSYIIHLAAIAHKSGQNDLSWNRYYRINTLCSKTLFEIAENKNIPVLFASTVDVYGITYGEVTPQTECHPIGEYAKSKYLAEKALAAICMTTPYTIARFAPVYTKENCTDKKKRYYLKYPNWCYRIGKGVLYEFLNIDKIVSFTKEWVEQPLGQRKVNLYDKLPLNISETISSEREQGRAKHQIVFPMWMIKLMKFAVSIVFGKQSYKAYMMAKLITPIHFERG